MAVREMNDKRERVTAREINGSREKKAVRKMKEKERENGGERNKLNRERMADSTAGRTKGSWHVKEGTETQSEENGAGRRDVLCMKAKERKREMEKNLIVLPLCIIMLYVRFFSAFFSFDPFSPLFL